MLSSFEVTDFRCFKKLALTDLARVNVVTGSNASGKSALLEAIYLGASATAQAFQNVAASRGLSGPPIVLGPLGLPVAVQVSPNLSSYFDNLFRSTYDQNGVLQLASKITISFSDSEEITYKLGIAYQPNATELLPVERTASGIGPQVPIMLERVRSAPSINQRSSVVISMNPFGQMQQMLAPPFGPTTFFFGAESGYAEQDNVTWFSQLKEKNRAEKTISFLRSEFPFIDDIEILAPSGVNGLYAKLRDGNHRRVSNVSAGVYKIVSILLSISSVSKGVIVIDEIENGLYYEKYPTMWRILYEFAKETENQLFISSHSAECLEALPPIIGDSVADFSLIRTERENGNCIARHISGTSMKAALKRGADIRGATE